MALDAFVYNYFFSSQSCKPYDDMNAKLGTNVYFSISMTTTSFSTLYSTLKIIGIFIGAYPPLNEIKIEKRQVNKNPTNIIKKACRDDIIKLKWEP